MKCEVCLKLLEEYIDGELAAPEVGRVSEHLIACTGCATAFEVLTAEQKIYGCYDRGLEVAPTMWPAIAARTTESIHTAKPGSRFRLQEWFALPSLGWSTWHGRPARMRALAGAMAMLIIAAAIGMLYLKAEKQRPTEQHANAKATVPGLVEIKQAQVGDKTPPAKEPDHTAVNNPGSVAGRVKATPKTQSERSSVADQSDVLFSDAAYSSFEEKETQQHIEQAQNLLRSVRNIEIDDDGTEVDVSYEKALSRRLLNENIVLRRDAEMSGKFPTRILLSDLEPFLIDIANLPDKPAPDDLRVLKERVLKTEIVAALQGY